MEQGKGASVVQGYFYLEPESCLYQVKTGVCKGSDWNFSQRVT